MSGHRRASQPSRVTGSFDGTRIGEGDWDRLKAGESAGESAKQAEISIGELPAILSIAGMRTRVAPDRGGLWLFLG